MDKGGKIVNETQECLPERTPRRKERLRWVLEHRQPDLTLVLANIHDPHNVSAIYRSADAFGLEAVHLYYTDTAFPALSSKTSASARKWVRSFRHGSLEDLRTALAGFQVLITSCSPSSRPFREWDYTKPSAIIMGNEHRGVDEELGQIAHGELYIPMYGMIQSFNVSVAAALILGEASRQRENAGLYASPRLDRALLEERFCEWMTK